MWSRAYELHRGRRDRPEQGHGAHDVQDVAHVLVDELLDLPVALRRGELAHDLAGM